MGSGDLEIRPSVPDDAHALPAAVGWIERATVTTITAESGGRAVAIAAIFSGGGETDPEAPFIRILMAPGGEPHTVLPPLVEAAVKAARASGHPRVLLGWDPMDAPGLKLLETLGFRTAGAMPYYEIGGGQVQYVTGYQDATGSTLELVRAI